MTQINTQFYKKQAQKAICNTVLQQALLDLQNRLGPATKAAYNSLAEGPALRKTAHDIRMHALENLDILLETLAQKIRQQGGHVFFAKDGETATNYCLEVARNLNVKMAVKGKSMVTEEIGLNTALMRNGIEVNETDLGEYIIQLAKEGPSHIIAPAIHKTRKQIGKLFSEKLGIPYTDDPPTLTKAARRVLREKFLRADMGISGCNLACAETGHITTVSNEGNIRMSSTMPKVHMVFMGMERVVAKLQDHDILFRLLARGASAQNMAGYVSYIGGPRSADQLDGPDEFHLVILDNGRNKILADKEFREVLTCIRCAACLNVCPVYGKIGGHAYGFPYSGPIGAVLTPLMVGINKAHDLCQGETLCGACRKACPVDNDLPRMLLLLRAKLADGDKDWEVERNNPAEKIMFMAWSVLIRNRKLFDMFLRAGYWIQKVFPRENGLLKKLPLGLNGWTASRDIKPIAPHSFILLWKKKHR
ncbi:MAG: iron-sulfur cluster-binding protein [Proteobacteria bacterium]|nr:iron-sulfur cluster-binding protein [Pseudomonadota bacterium]MBU1584918.1 iron-sulfur cluster-binding protein [Pseudomonadota bacterium]MBU2456269.1 iron-sulfur cluster-binding protein [Pseudomonadota bacterium]MBU2630458.1 iron-sulfur cluster-binding protein [Pseudomonadota bacterium]